MLDASLASFGAATTPHPLPSVPSLLPAANPCLLYSNTSASGSTLKPHAEHVRTWCQPRDGRNTDKADALLPACSPCSHRGSWSWTFHLPQKAPLLLQRRFLLACRLHSQQIWAPAPTAPGLQAGYPLRHGLVACGQTLPKSTAHDLPGRERI